MKIVSKIDVSQWGEFKVGDLFEPVLTDGDNKQGELPDGDIPLISATADNNGVVGYYESNTTVFPANSITVDMFGHAFVQPKEFQTVAHGRVNVLLTGDLSFNAGCLVASVIERAASLHEFGFKTMLNQHKLKNLKIKLPITSDGKPDWDYMDNYIAKLAARAHRDVSSLDQVKPKPHKINISSWKEFKIGDLLNFDSSKQIYHAENLDILDKPADNSYHPYVVRSGFNNGIRGYINENPNTLNPGNTISFAQDTAQLFYQAEPYFTGNKIKICSLKGEQELTKPISLFLIASLLKSFSIFSWDSSFNVTTLKRVKIKLPIKSDGKPDWDYMDNYITNLTTRTFKDVNSLCMLTGM